MPAIKWTCWLVSWTWVSWFLVHPLSQYGALNMKYYTLCHSYWQHSTSSRVNLAHSNNSSNFIDVKNMRPHRKINVIKNNKIIINIDAIITIQINLCSFKISQDQIQLVLLCNRIWLLTS